MKNKKWITFSLATAITLSMGASFIPSTYAESSVDPAPEIAAKVVNQNNGKKYYSIIHTVKLPGLLTGLSMVAFLISETALPKTAIM